MNKKVKFVSPKALKDRHKTYFRASQVERSLLPEAFHIGLRVAVLDSLDEFCHGKTPKPVFYTGTVTRVTTDLISIEYDAHPRKVGVTFGGKEYARFCIAIPTRNGKEEITTKTTPGDHQ